MAGDSDAKRAYRVTQWELYEPNRKAGGADGPLTFAKWRLHGFNPGPSFRRLQQLPINDFNAAFALFGKLIEMAGGQPRAIRDGLIRAKCEGPAATVADIAFNLYGKDGPAECERVATSLKHLLDPSVGWIERVDPPERENDGASGDGRGRAGGRGDERADAGTSGDERVKVRSNGDGDGDIDLENSPPLLPPPPPSPPNSFPEPQGRHSDSVSSRKSKGHAGIQASTHAKLMGMLGVPAGTTRNSLSIATRRQAASDETSLFKMCRFVIQSSDPAGANKEAGELLKLARSFAHRVRPMPGFVDDFKKEWPDLWPEIRAGPLKQAAAL